MVFAYDIDGNTTTMVDPTGTTTYTYDALSRMSGKTDFANLEKPGLVQAYSYDAVSQRTNLTDPDGQVRTYVYDVVGRPVSMIALSKTLAKQYDLDGRLTTVTVGGLSETSQLDAVGNVLLRKGTGWTQTSTYDSMSNPLTQYMANGNLKTYTYDALNRLSYMECSGQSNVHMNFSFDSVGNRTYGQEWGNRQYTYDKANRLVTMTSVDPADLVTFVYDGNDNQVSAYGPTGAHPVSMSMVYDYENRLVVVDDVLSSEVLTYTYSGDGLKRSEAKVLL